MSALSTYLICMLAISGRRSGDTVRPARLESSPLRCNVKLIYSILKFLFDWVLVKDQNTTTQQRWRDRSKRNPLYGTRPISELDEWPLHSLSKCPIELFGNFCRCTLFISLDFIFNVMLRNIVNDLLKVPIVSIGMLGGTYCICCLPCKLLASVKKIIKYSKDVCVYNKCHKFLFFFRDEVTRPTSLILRGTLAHSDIVTQNLLGSLLRTLLKNL